MEGRWVWVMEQVSNLERKFFQYVRADSKHPSTRIISCPGQVVPSRSHGKCRGLDAVRQRRNEQPMGNMPGELFVCRDA